MAYQLTEKLRNLTPYEPISGNYKVRLDANESFLNIGDGFATRFAAILANLDFNRYPDPYASKLCAQFAGRFGVDPAYVTASNGSDEMISVILSSFLQKGEKLLTLAPDFSMYAFYGALVECEVCTLQKRGDLTIAPDAVLQTLRETGARLLIFSNPCNPTSLGLSREDVRRIIRGTDALVVLDEAYMDFWDQSLIGEFNEYENLILLKTCSKALGAAAMRLGFAMANQTLTTAMRAAKSPYNVNALTQAMGEAVLSERTLVQRCVKEILNSRRELQESLEALAGEKEDIVTVYQSCTNFVFMEMRDARAVYEALLKKSIAVRLMGKYLRITAGSHEENREVAAALKQILN